MHVHRNAKNCPAQRGFSEQEMERGSVDSVRELSPAQRGFSEQEMERRLVDSVRELSPAQRGFSEPTLEAVSGI